MAGNDLGVTIKYKGDASGAVGATALLQNRIKSLGTSIVDDIGANLKTAFAAGSIVEMTRKTGEYTQALDKMAIALGVSADHLQTLDLLAQQANVDPAKAQGFLDTLDEQRKAAINGNYDLVQSFQAIGVSYKELQSSTKSELLGKVLSNKGISNIVQGTPLGHAAENVFGPGNLPTVQALVNTAGGRNMEQMNQEAVSNGDIISADDTKEMSDAWKEVKLDFQQALVQLVPIGKILLSLAAILSETVLGAALALKHSFALIKNLFSGDFQGVLQNAKGLFAGLVMNAIFGFAKTITGLIDLVSERLNSLVRRIPILGKLMGKHAHSYTSDVQGLQDRYNSAVGVSRNDIRGGEGLGNSAAVVGTGGTGAVAKVGEKVAMDAAGMLEKAGAFNARNAALNTAVRLDKYGYNNGVAGALVKKLNAGRVAGATAEGLPGVLGEQASLSRLAGGAAGLGAAGVVGNNNITHNGQGVTPPGNAPYNGIMMNQPPISFRGESNSMLKFGGVFGSGIQSKMIRLNEQMVSILTQIARNTQYNRFGSLPPNNANPNAQYSGGF